MDSANNKHLASFVRLMSCLMVMFGLAFGSASVVWSQTPETQPPTEVPQNSAPENPPDQPDPIAPIIPEPDDSSIEDPSESLEPVPQPAENSSVTVEPSEPDVSDPLTTSEPAPGTAEPLVTPTPTPEPTIEPAPVITWSQAEPVKCELRDGTSPGLRYAESRTYHCQAVANVSSDFPMPDDMQIEWGVEVDFPASYTLQLPQGSLASVMLQQVVSATDTRYSISHPWLQGSTQRLEFELVVTRTTCDTSELVLNIQASPEITTVASEAEIKRQEGNIHPEPARLISPVIDSAAPSITFDGPIAFETVSGTTMGLETDISRGTASITVIGEWDPCTTWTVDLSGNVGVPAETPAVLRVVSINNEPNPGSACDLSVPCDIIVLPETGNAAIPLRYTIGLELQLHELTPVGSFGIDLRTEIHGVGTKP